MPARSRRGVNRRPAVALAGENPPAWYQVGPVLALATAPDGTDTTTTTSADVYVFDTIGGWFGLTADDFVRDVASLDVDQIVLHLNSPGGDATEGVAIANVLRAHRARVVVRVDGLAASAGSVIAMAGDEIVMGIGAQMMIHDAWGVAIGDAAEITSYARRLDSTSDSYAASYAARAGGTAEQWREVMRAETWYTAEEAVAAGLADRVAAADETGTAEGEQVTPGAGSYLDFWGMWDSLRDPDRHDLSAYRHAGRAQAPAPVMPVLRTTPAATAAGRSTTERSDNVSPFLDDVRQRLGVAAGADEATTMAALDEALQERAEAGTRGAPEGTVIVDAAQWESTRAAAQRGAEAADRQSRDDREQLVLAAIDDGRIAPASREHWLAQLETGGEGAAATLASLQKGLVPVREIGHGGDGGDDGPAARMKSGSELYALRHGKTA